MSNNEELITLLKQEGIDVKDEDAVRRFLQKLTSTIENDGKTLDMIEANLDRYKGMVRAALEDAQVPLKPGDFGSEEDS
jgi:hypothetical protein